MIRRRGKIARVLLMIGNAAPTIADGARGSWRERKWLVPLIVFLCVTGIILVAAASVEALAPFVYAVF
jgi:hypothetical protein